MFLTVLVKTLFGHILIKMSTFRGSLANVTVINYWQPTRFPLTNEQIESAIALLPDRHTWRFAPMYFGAFYKQILIRWCGGGIEVRDYARIVTGKQIGRAHV